MNTIITQEEGRHLESLFLGAVRGFVEALYNFSEPEFNRVPFEGSWSAAGVGSHINKSMLYIHQVLTGATSDARRDPKVFIPALRQMMEDMHIKSRSGAALLPDLTFTTRQEVREKLTGTEQLLLLDIQSLNLSKICTALEFPGMGQLSVFELGSFSAFHIIRHRKQLQCIHYSLQHPQASV